VERRRERYSFASLVLVGLACASYLAGSAAVPEPVPDFALQAAEIHRLEIGAAFFVAFYLATMAVVLALAGKGFAEFGPRGLKAQQVVEHIANDSQQEALSRQVRALHQVRRELKALYAQVENLKKSQSPQRDLEKLSADG
jgi:H+/gluconate symporter-like permease